VTSVTFLAVMEDTALCHVPVGAVFQLDGAPPHFSRHVLAFMDREFLYCWIGGGGGILWPPRSPDLTPLDCFF
jgi:hypothetical protein